MLQHIIDFLVDFFTNLNAKKIVGGVIVLVGLWILSNLGAGRGGDGTVLIAVAGILVASIGVIVMYYDMAKDKSASSYSELETLANAEKPNKKEEINVSSWHMEEDADDNTTSSR